MFEWTMSFELSNRAISFSTCVTCKGPLLCVQIQMSFQIGWADKTLKFCQIEIKQNLLSVWHIYIHRSKFTLPHCSHTCDRIPPWTTLLCLVRLNGCKNVLSHSSHACDGPSPIVVNKSDEKSKINKTCYHRTLCCIFIRPSPFLCVRTCLRRQAACENALSHWRQACDRFCWWILTLCPLKLLGYLNNWLQTNRN